MREVLLTSICRPKQWKTISTRDLKSEGYPVYGANGKIGFYNTYTHENPTILITCRGATCGSINISEPKSYVNGNAMALDNLSKDVDLYFLKHYLEYRKLDDVISGSAQPQITGQGLANIQIPLPPLETQQKIAAILDAADVYRQKTKALIAKYDELTQSLFLDMFGDYIINKGSFIEINKIAKFIDYRGKTPERVDYGIPFISAKCVRIGYFDKKRLDFITEETYNKIMTRGYPQIGDVLFTTEGATMGFTCRIPKGFDKFSIGQRLITLQANNNYNSAVLEFMLNSKVIQDEINSLATGSAVKGIRSAKFAKIKIPNPPISIQSQFAKCIAIIEQQKALAQDSLEKSEELFNSLLQKAFKGELV